jgi:hypothetical protein
MHAALHDVFAGLLSCDGVATHAADVCVAAIFPQQSLDCATMDWLIAGRGADVDCGHIVTCEMKKNM